MDSLGCKHYKRGCKLICPTCNTDYWCRHCHNEINYDNITDPKKAHKLERKNIKEIICGKCKEKQPVTNHCRKCSLQFGNYFCNICKFFDYDDKGQFHCDKCGICRIGGKDNFFHCDKCIACLPLSIQNNHKCLDGSLKVNCPLCLEYLMDSTKPSTILDCGHSIHTHCKQDLINSGISKCPICNTSMIDMQAEWTHLNNLIKETPMPEIYLNWYVKILCSDCHQETNTLFHVLGLKCLSCNGFNTRRIGNEMPPNETTSPPQLSE